MSIRSLTIPFICHKCYNKVWGLPAQLPCVFTLPRSGWPFWSALHDWLRCSHQNPRHQLEGYRRLSNEALGTNHTLQTTCSTKAKVSPTREDLHRLFQRMGAAVPLRQETPRPEVNRTPRDPTTWSFDPKLFFCMKSRIRRGRE